MESVRALLQLGADPTTANPRGLTPFHVAASSGNLEIIKLMDDKKEQLMESMNQKGQTPLYGATKKGRLETVEWLVANGANVEVKDKSGTSLLSVSANKGHVDVVRFLVAHGLATDSTIEVHILFYLYFLC